MAGIGLIMVGGWEEIFNLNLVYTLGVVVLAAIILHLTKWEDRIYSFRWISGSILFVFWLLLGALLTLQSNQLSHNHHFSNQQNVSVFCLKVVEPFHPTTSSNRALVEVAGVKDSSGTLLNTQGKVLLYCKKPIDTLQPGDLILTTTKPQRIASKVNRWGFDYPTFLARKQIYHQAFVQQKDLLVFHSNIADWETEIKKIRYQLLEKAKQAFTDEKPFGVFAALVLGYRNELEGEIQSAYANAGTMHVLAVSGLHVGILYFLLSVVVKPIKRFRWGQHLAAILVLLGIWFFAFLTGLSPSIWRAAIMFSLVVIADNLDRNSNIFNTLATAALIILLNDPMLIASVGFQLSFLAVIGIVLLFPPLYQLVTPTHRITNYLWGLVCVSIAAQTAVLPLSLFYFNQMPLYFIPANLVVIPLATLNLSLGLFSLLLSFAEPVFSVLINMLEFLLTLQNTAIAFISDFPLSTIAGLYVDPPQLILLYLFMVGVLGFLLSKHKQFLWFGVLALVLFLAWFTYQRTQHYTNEELVVFHHAYGPIIALQSGGEGAVWISHSKQESGLGFDVFPFFLQKGIKTPTVTELNDSLALGRLIQKEGFLWWQGKRLFYFDGRSLPPDANIVITSAFHFTRNKEDILATAKNKVVVVGQIEKLEPHPKVHITQKEGPFRYSP